MNEFWKMGLTDGEVAKLREMYARLLAGGSMGMPDGFLGFCRWAVNQRSAKAIEQLQHHAARNDRTGHPAVSRRRR